MQNNHNRKTWGTITPKDLLSPAGRKYMVSKEPDVTFPLLITGISIVAFIVLFNDFEHYNMTFWFLLLLAFVGAMHGLAYFLRWEIRKLIAGKHGSDAETGHDN